jgi:hypothetical protein
MHAKKLARLLVVGCFYACHAQFADCQTPACNIGMVTCMQVCQQDKETAEDLQDFLEEQKANDRRLEFLGED